MKTSYFTSLSHILGHIALQDINVAVQRYYFIRDVSKYHEKLGCQAKWGGVRRAHPHLDPPM